MKALLVSSLLVFAFSAAHADNKEQRLEGAKCRAQLVNAHSDAPDSNIQILIKGKEQAYSKPYGMPGYKVFTAEHAQGILANLEADGCTVDRKAIDKVLAEREVAP